MKWSRLYKRISRPMVQQRSWAKKPRATILGFNSPAFIVRVSQAWRTLVYSSHEKTGTSHLKQPRRRQLHKPHKFAYLTMKNSIFARFARAFFIFWHFEDVLVLSMTWNDLFCSCVDDVSECSILSCPRCWFQFNSRIVKAHFSGIMTLNTWKMLAETEVTVSDDVLASVDVVFG